MKTVTANVSNQTAPRSDLVDSLFEIGSDWARYGIGMGITAVRSQASLFRTLSKTLEHAADALADVAKPIPKTPAAAADEVIDTTATDAK